MSVAKFTEEFISAICRGVRPSLAPFPPLVKTPRGKRFDLVTDGRVTRGLGKIRVCHYLCMEGKEQPAREKRKMERESSGKGRESCK